MALDRRRARQCLRELDFQRLFIEELGWSAVARSRPKPIGDSGYSCRGIAEMSGLPVLEVFPSKKAADSDMALPDAKTCRALHREIEKDAYENVIIFLDADGRRRMSKLYWVKREDGKKRPRSHHYFRGQSGDSLLSKIDGMVIDINDLLADGGAPPISVVTGKLSAALDIERVTKKFFKEFSDLRLDFIDQIQGIDSAAERGWYASVLLNRLMFIYFLQKKGFIQNNQNYLDDKLAASQARGRDRYYSEFLDALFFEGFAKPAHQRSAQARSILGEIPYLNGGLFIRHKLELEHDAIRIPDRAFAQALRLFGHYDWYLDDNPGTQDNEINPDVLGYIFEKYINQKAFGAYYTRTEITEYLCQRSIHSVILQQVAENGGREFADMNELLQNLDAGHCRILLNVLGKLSILDPACGSGAFLVAAMKNLLDIYGPLCNTIKHLNKKDLNKLLRDNKLDGADNEYAMRKRIISDNLYGVDIMPEAAEIAKLRLFLALVGAAQGRGDLEPLPNIDFNILAGNSLIGLLDVDERRFDQRAQTQSMLQRLNAQNYRRAVAEKNRLIQLYRDADRETSDYLQDLRERINQQRADAQTALDGILLDDFQALKIQYEQARLKGPAQKRPLTSADIAALQPFHWGYEFDEILARGGFDVIITNPPWEVFKPQDEEFFADYDDRMRQKRANRVEKRRIKARLLEDDDIRRAYLAYQSGYRHVSAFFRGAPQYQNQISRVNGRKQGSDINLYKLFTEQCFHLLRDGGACGIVMPSGIYSDLGTKQLRQMLFEKTRISGLFGFENRKAVFEGVHKSFKFVVLTFIKKELRFGGGAELPRNFYAA